MSEMGMCVCKKEGLCLCNRWEVTVYNDHGSLCVCVCTCACADKQENSPMCLCAASRESFHVTNAGPVVCGTVPRDAGELSVCLFVSVSL